jgi:hypothetical protein
VTPITDDGPAVRVDFKNSLSVGRIDLPLMTTIWHTSVLAERIIHAALDVADSRKQELCDIVTSKSSTAAERYEALLTLAHMTGILKDGYQFSRSI